MNRKTLCGVITVVSALAADATNNYAIHRVRSGGGNSTAPLTVFIHENNNDKAGESVMWDNASTVTFILDNKTPLNIVSSFALPNSTICIYAF
ncbi:MAG: hypothetical protein ACJ71O_02030 [Nitrososphaeraceae archaeon]